MANHRELLTNHSEKLASVVNHSEKLASVQDKESIANIANQTKNQTLVWAISNSYLRPPKFQRRNIYGYRGEDVVRDILLNFRLNRGYDISGYGFTLENGKTIASNAEAEGKFRKDVFDFIHKLTGQKPRLELEGKYRWLIYYS